MNVLNLVKNEGRKFTQAWDRFWFAPLDLFPLSVFRLVFCFLLFVFYVIRLCDYKGLFSNEGMIPFSVLNEIVPSGYAAIVPWEVLAGSDILGLSVYVLFLIGLLGLSVGLWGRRVAWLVFIGHVVFLKRNPLIIYGADLVATFFLFYLTLADSTRHLKIPLPWGKRTEAYFPQSSARVLTSDLLSTVAYRFLQIQLSIIYMYSGLEKAKGMTWWQGDAVWNTLANGQLVTINLGAVFRHFPVIVAIMTFFTLLWEVYFPFIVWIKSLRKYTLTFGLFLHGMIGMIMNIPFFSFFMLSVYVLFIEPEHLREFMSKLGKRFFKNSQNTEQKNLVTSL